MSQTPQTNIRLNKLDRKHIAAVKEIMKAADRPENDITLSGAIRYALEQTAKGAKQ